MKPLDVIPDSTYYCYSGALGKGLCPYWKKTEAGDRCEFLEVDSVEYDHNNLIWDMVKECGVKTDIKERLETNIERYRSTNQ